MSSTPTTTTSYSSETENHVSGAGILEGLDPSVGEPEVEKYLEGILADVETSESNQNHDFDVWTTSGSHASVSYREENGKMYVWATGGEMAVDTVLSDAETGAEYMEELEDIWF